MGGGDLTGVSVRRRLAQLAVTVFAVVLIVAGVAFGFWATITRDTAVFGRLTGLAGVLSFVLTLVAVAAGMLVRARRKSLNPVPPSVPTTGIEPVAIAERDVYAAGANQTVINNYMADGVEAQVPRALQRKVWAFNIPERNPDFIDRDQLTVIRQKLVNGVTVQVLYGMSGSGKTQLVTQYVHRFASDYDLVWWIAAEAELIGQQFAALSQELGLALPSLGHDEAFTQELGSVPPKYGRDEMWQQALWNVLHGLDRWLLVFDNAENPSDLIGWLPGGPGHVLITSLAAAPRWSGLAVPVEIPVMTRAESVAMLRHQVNGLPEDDADRVADAVGDLPLALAQAAAYLVGGMSAERYTGLLADRPTKVLNQRLPLSHPASLPAVTQLGLDLLRREDRAAAELAGLCAFLAPEPIPADWFTNPATHLRRPLAEQAADPQAWQDLTARLSGSALAHSDGSTLRMHRLTQAIIREHLSASAASTGRRVEAILASNVPGDASDPSTWPAWERLLPHLRAMDLVATRNADLCAAACGAIWYLVQRGDARSGESLGQHLYDQWRDKRGPDDRYTLWAANSLASALAAMGRHRQAKELNEETYARDRRIYGDDHPYTLTIANNLGVNLRMLGEYEDARALDEKTLNRSRQMLGEDDPHTLDTASNLAVDLRMLGDVARARAYDEDTLNRRSHQLSEDHPSTLISASNLAIDMLKLGEVQEARELNETILSRRRRVLGENHPETLVSAMNLGTTLHALGDFSAARNLDEDTLSRSRFVLGDSHPLTAQLADNFARDLRALTET